MTPGGWIIMCVSVGFVTGLLGWCALRVLTTPKAEEHLHAPQEIDTHDED